MRETRERITRSAAVVLAPVVALALAALVGCGEPAVMHAEAQSRAADATEATPDGILPLEEFSPTFLGMYRKVMEIEPEIRRYAEQYGVDVDLARAVAIQESGGNADLSSAPGANGYFQLMPATFRSLRVESNIEAGIKYLSQMIRRFEREDYGVAAYNGGPGRVVRGRPPLETLQYVLSVESYRMVLKMYDDSVRHHASAIELEPIGLGDDWWSISRRVGIPVVQLRLHNPFLATRRMRVGRNIAYPPAPRDDLISMDGGDLLYRGRIGDNYLLLAFTLGVTPDALREVNKLWHLGSLPRGMQIRIPLEWEGKYNEYRVGPTDTLPALAERHDSNVWRIIRDNALWDEQLTPGTIIKIRPQPTRPAAPRPSFTTYRVSRGDTLSAIARRHGTSVRAIQDANDMGRRTRIQIGQRLRVPVRAQN